jgi:hypothetical protein
MGWWWRHHHQRYIHTYTSIYFVNTTWSYYSVRARRLTHQVSSLLSSSSSYLDNGDTCTLVLLKNNGVDQKASHRLDSDCRIDTTCDSCHDFIRTPFWVFKYLLESLSSLLSNGNNRFTTESFSAYGAASPYFGPMGRVSSWVQFGRVLRLGYDPSTLVVILPLSYNS